MNKTNIEYLDFTWNPLAMRCTPISEGCANCWHLTMANRMALNWTLPYRNAYCEGESPVLVKSRLEDPLKRKKPAIIGVQFMGDLFHEDVTYEQQVEIFQVIAEASWHTVLILTKRPKNMFDFIQSIEDWEWYHFQHVWWGVTAENQQTADERIPILLQIPAAKRFVSIEPMLGWVDLTSINVARRHKPLGQSEPFDINALTGDYCFTDDGDYEFDKLDWVIAGCESGPKRRQAYAQWFRELKNQCVEAGIPFFLKQAGGYIAGKPSVVKMPYLDGRQWAKKPDQLEKLVGELAKNSKEVNHENTSHGKE